MPGVPSDWGAYRVSGPSPGKRLHGGKARSDRGAYASDPIGPLGGLQARLAEATLAICSKMRIGRAGRSDRHRHSGGSAEPGDGDGANHAGCRGTFSAVRLTRVAAQRACNPREQGRETGCQSSMRRLRELTHPDDGRGDRRRGPSRFQAFNCGDHGASGWSLHSLASLGVLRMTARLHRNQQPTPSPPSKSFVVSVRYRRYEKLTCQKSKTSL